MHRRRHRQQMRDAPISFLLVFRCAAKPHMRPWYQPPVRSARHPVGGQAVCDKLRSLREQEPVKIAALVDHLPGFIADAGLVNGVVKEVGQRVAEYLRADASLARRSIPAQRVPPGFGAPSLPMRSPAFDPASESVLL